MHTELVGCRTRLAHRVLHRTGPHGLICAPATSRVLETSLLLFLLTAEDLAPAHADVARSYLKDALDNNPPDPLQCAFARAALGEPVPGDAAQRALASFTHFSSPRKLLSFTVLLAELTGAPPPPGPPADAFDTRYEQVWVRFQMLALKTIVTPHAATPADLARLTPALAPGPPWQANNLARLLGLLALRKVPAHRPAVRRALEQLADEQLPGGGLPFITGLDIFATALAGIALTRTHPGNPRLTGMAGTLARHQNPDGGFGFTAGVTQSDTDDTAYVVEFLRTTTHRHADTLAAAERHLLALRNPDGGFPTFVHGAPSEIAMTAGAVNALAPNPAHRAVIEDAVAFLLENDTVIERSWSRNSTNAVFRTTLAYAALPADAPAGMRAGARTARARGLRHLLDTQQADGGWGHTPDEPTDPISTAYAVIALSRAPEHTPELDRALHYLRIHQQPDGGYLSRPDQAGPRPLLYDTPALADICVLLALTTPPGHEHKVGLGPAPEGRPGGRPVTR
ncbi:prenyltransferase/squalene oxidase repeat-containing protein [Streptomyces abikoensis]|uniref:prenyltransferase/squalene oxidase repeat-containing protein n=1 Tax=Streptomyces abikoensis TaxID=97398 RepID=UPI003402669A